MEDCYLLIPADVLLAHQADMATVLSRDQLILKPVDLKQQPELQPYPVLCRVTNYQVAQAEDGQLYVPDDASSAILFICFAVFVLVMSWVQDNCDRDGNKRKRRH